MRRVTAPIKHRLYGVQRIAFKPVVHVNECLAAWLLSCSVGNQAGAGFARFLVHFLCPVIWLERLYRVFVFSTGFEEETGRKQFRVRSTAGERYPAKSSAR